MKSRIKIPPLFNNILMFSWIILVSFFFFKNWKPFSLIINQAPFLPEEIFASFLRLFDHGLKDVVILAIFALSSFGAGLAILAPLRLAVERMQRLTLSFAAGLGIISYLVLFLGLGRCYNKRGLLLLLAVLGIFAVLGAISLRNKTASIKPAARTKLWWVFVALSAMEGVYLLSKSLTPAVFYDAVTYHLGVPNYYLLEGGIKYIPSDAFSNFPFLAEMIYTLGMFVSGLKLAQMTSVALFLACAFAVYDFSRSFIKEVDPALPGMLFLSTPAFIEDSVLYTNDLHLAYFALLSVYGLFLWMEKKEDRYLAVSGLFMGLSLSVKYIALVSVLAPVAAAVLYISLKEGKSSRRIAKEQMLLVVPAIIVFLPWMLKNLAYTGNPLYPAFFSVLGGKDMNASQYALIQSLSNKAETASAIKGVPVNLWEVFILNPNELFVKFGAASFLNPILLMTVPFIMYSAKNIKVKVLVFIAAAMYILWVFTFPLTRFLFPSLFLMLMISSYSIAYLWHGFPRGTKPFAVTLFLFFVLTGISVGFFQVDLWTGSRGISRLNEDDGGFLMRQLAHKRTFELATYPAYRFVDEKTGPDSRVLIIGDAQHLYINRRHVYAFISASNPFGQFRQGPEEVLRNLRSEGITHIVYNPVGFRSMRRMINYPDDDNMYIEKFLRGPHARLVASFDNPKMPVYLFEVV